MILQKVLSVLQKYKIHHCNRVHKGDFNPPLRIAFFHIFTLPAAKFFVVFCCTIFKPLHMKLCLSLIVLCFALPAQSQTASICGDAVPPGWITTAISSAYCRTLGTTSYIGRTIQKYDCLPTGRTMQRIDSMPPGSTVNICGDVPPEGWVTTSIGSSYCTTLGTTSYIGRTIQRIELEPCLAPQSVSAANGNWNNPATWVGGIVPPAGATVLVTHSVTVTADAACAALTVKPPGVLTVNNAVILKVGNQ